MEPREVESPAFSSTQGYLGLPISAADLTLGRYLDQVSMRHSGREALVSRGRRLSYQQLAQEVHEFAKGLIACGVTKGAKVAVLLGSHAEFIIAVFGAAYLGAVVVPLSTLSTPEELDYLLWHSDASVLITEQNLRQRRFIDELVARHPGIGEAEPGRIFVEAFPHLRRMVSIEPDVARGVQSWEQLVAAGECISDALLAGASASVYPSDDGIIIYTSGTTAHPKAVLHRQRSPVLQSWRWTQQLRLDPDDRVWTSFPFFWTAGLATAIGGTLGAGACLVCQASFEPGEALALMEAERVTTAHAFPQAETQILDHKDLARRDLSTLRKVPAWSLLLRVVTPHDEPWGPQGFGLSETFTLATSLPSGAPAKLTETTHGVPPPGTSLRIVDPTSGEPRPTGASGEITVKGLAMMRGYYKVDPEQCFDDEGWFHTQDAGHLDDQGYLHWEGRLSGVIKTAGANVAPAEVESVLQHWGELQLVSVIGLPHPTLGEAVVLCAVQSDAHASPEEIMAHLRSVLAPYKVPKLILWFTREQLAFTGSDKVQVDHLRSLAAQRVAAGSDAWAQFLRARHTALLDVEVPGPQA